MKTTIELPDALLEEVRRIAAREGTTVKAILEAGLREAVAQYNVKRAAPFKLRDGSVGGKGLQPDLRDASWDRIRDLGYEGRGS